MKPQKIARLISTGKGTSFGHSEIGHAQLTLKYLCLFCVCYRNVFHTSNASCLSIEMGNLLYAIDKQLEFIDFGHMVITKMLDFVAGTVAESKLLPYFALITKLLEQ